MMESRFVSALSLSLSLFLSLSLSLSFSLLSFSSLCPYLFPHPPFSPPVSCAVGYNKNPMVRMTFLKQSTLFTVYNTRMRHHLQWDLQSINISITFFFKRKCIKFCLICLYLVTSLLTSGSCSKSQRSLVKFCCYCFVLLWISGFSVMAVDWQISAWYKKHQCSVITFSEALCTKGADTGGSGKKTQNG